VSAGNSQGSVEGSAGASVVRVPAFELKFLVSAAVGDRVQSWASSELRLAPDPHGDVDGAYTTASLYLDTPQLDVYHRSESYRRRKFRIRRYASSPGVYLERKTKSNDRVSKRRSPIAESELGALALPMSLETWPAHWFHRRIVLKRLGPACWITYRRTALVGSCAEGPLRMTIDRDVRGALAGEWRVPVLEGGAGLLNGLVILELKFLRALPLPFKRVVEEFRLTPAPVSKYRLCREGCAGTTGSIKANEAARA
jgi:hypothetical protein